MMWDAFCEEHFEEALEHIKKKHPDYDIGYYDAYTKEDFRDDDPDVLKEYICGYPECEKYPCKEIIYMEPVSKIDLTTSSAYKPLE